MNALRRAAGARGRADGGPGTQQPAFTRADAGEVNDPEPAGHSRARPFVTGQMALTGGAAQALTMEARSDGRYPDL
jgi:hypothetical protein